MDDRPLDVAELDALEAAIDGWLDDQRSQNPAIAAVERGDPGERRWYVRVIGDQKPVHTVWLTLGQRRLHVETYFMPAPEVNAAALYEHLLRRNRALPGLTFAIGDEDAVYLVGAEPAVGLTAPAVDQLLGRVYEAVERCFRPAMRIGFAGRFAG